MKTRRSPPRTPPRGESLASAPTPRGAKKPSAKSLETAIELFGAELAANGARPKTVSTYTKALRVLEAMERDWRTRGPMGGWLLGARAEELLMLWDSESLKPSTRATYLAAVKAFRRSSTGRELPGMRELGHAGVKLDAPAPRPLAPDAERKLERAALSHRDPRFRLWYAFLRELGMRPSEPLGLQWEAIVLAPGRETVTIRDAKGRAAATLPISHGGRCNLLRRVRVAHPGGHRLSEWIFPGIHGGPWSYSAALAAWSALCRDLRLEATPHQLRHTAATSWLASGLDGEIVRRMLRHRSSAMIQRYAELTPEDLRRALRRGS